MSKSRNQKPASYTNLTATGLAFINRLRWVNSDGGEYLALSLNSWHGKDGKNTTLFEATAKGNTVYGILQDLMDQYPEVLNDEITVTCGFVVAGLKPDSYSNKKGELVHFNYCNLIRIQWIKVGGEYFYRENKTEAQEGYQGYDQDYQEEQEQIPAPPRRQSGNGNHQNNGDYPRQQRTQPQGQNGYRNGQQSQARQPAQQRGGQQGRQNRQEYRKSSSYRSYN